MKTIKSDWDIRKCFDGLRRGAYYDCIILTPELQNEICDLVERFYKKKTNKVIFDENNK